MDSTTLLEQIDGSQAQHEVTANNLFDAGSVGAAYGRHAETCAGLVWGYYGVRYGGSSVANGTNTCDGSDVTYMVANLVTGAVSFDIATTDWDDSASFGRCYAITTGPTTVTSYEDHRFGPLGIFGAAGSAQALSELLDVDIDGSPGPTNGQVLTFDSGSGKWIADDVPVSGGTITALTGDVTASGSGSVAATIANAAVSLAKMADLAQDQFIGRVTASTGVPETATITAAARTVLDDTTTSAMRTTLGLAIGSDVQAYDADLATIAGLTATTDNFIQSKSSAWASRTVAQVSADLQATGLVTDAVGFRTIPQNSQSTAYTTVAADAGKHLLHPSADTTARTFTIDSNANVAYPVGTAITFVNQNSAGVLTIAITSDTMRLAGAGTTGSRTLAANGVATALKVTSTEWIISGTGLT